jgi:hypothetical protein
MAEPAGYNHPWMIAIWPGMGNIALNAGVYLLAKLQMSMLAELEARDLFDVEHIDVKDGILRLGRRPRNRFFVWRDPNQRHDLLLFLGEAQPPLGKYVFCQKLLDFGKQLGVERVFTFAAMATQMHPEHPSRVFAAATDRQSLDDLKHPELEVLENGRVGGLNGVLLGVAAENGMSGVCLLGEMPHIFSQLPFPKASLAILKVYARLAGIELDFSELAEQARIMEERLGELLARVEEAYGKQFGAEEEEEGYTPEAPEPEQRMSPADKRRIEQLFGQAAEDRSKAFELKQELDRLGVFKEYEDRFLDLFKKPQ